MRKNGHLDECEFKRGEGWQCAEGCEKAGSQTNYDPPEATAQQQPASRGKIEADYAKHPKFAKFQKGNS